MVKRIPQRTMEDCSICVLAMGMGGPYDYERVLRDSAKYQATAGNGKFLAWWERYLADEGFQGVYRPFADLCKLRELSATLHEIQAS
jgi:hypothetical protein